MESPDARPETPEGLRGRLYENLDIVEAALPSVSCLPMIPVSNSNLRVMVGSSCYVQLQQDQMLHIVLHTVLHIVLRISSCAHLNPEHKIR